MRTYSFKKYIISTIILLVTIFFNFKLASWDIYFFNKDAFLMQTFLLAMLCGWSIREVWSDDYDDKLNKTETFK